MRQNIYGCNKKVQKTHSKNQYNGLLGKQQQETG